MFCVPPVQRFTLCAAVSLTVSSRVSNSEKKLEAVRSGVRAISVSGRTPGAHVSSHTSTASQPLCPSSVQLLSLSLPLSVHFLQQLFLFLFLCVSLTVSPYIWTASPSPSLPSVPPPLCLLPPFSRPFTLSLPSPLRDSLAARLVRRPGDVDGP